MFRTPVALSVTALVVLTPMAFAGDPVLPFDFNDAYYRANGIEPTGLIGRPTGAPPNSIIDTRDNGPEYGNVRVLQQGAAYDHSGHVVFFYVTGLLSVANFTPDAAGTEARVTADSYVVYEFPRATNPLGAVFPKRQDLIADLSGGYFSNDPLGIWQVNIIKYSDAAFSTPAGREALLDLAQRNGYDLDGTPIIRTKSEVEGLLDSGFATRFVPADDGSQGLRWFFCPVIEDPRNGAIQPDAHVDVTEGFPAAAEFHAAFGCLQQTGDVCDNHFAHCDTDIGGDGATDIDDLLFVLGSWGECGVCPSDFTFDGEVGVDDLLMVLGNFGPCN